MNDTLRERLAAIPSEVPDDIDLAMIADASLEDDGTTMPLEVFKQSLAAYSGKMLVRMPKSLHRRLSEEARVEGVSINQYILYKLSH